MGARTRPQQGNGFGASQPTATATALPDSPMAGNAEVVSEGSAIAPDRFLGRVLSHYRLEEQLGTGAMGVLYRATDLKLGRSVAIKFLARHLVADETAKNRFAREARAASALDHPNIGAIHDIAEHDGELFIVMALYQGETLKQRLEKGPLAVDEAVGILRQMTLGLDAAHRAGIVHRDIKPANVFVTSDGTVKILDFGLAKLASEAQGQTMTQAGQTMGTLLYMSPEQLRGEPVDQRSDLWSLGVLAYEMVAGFSPFRAATSAATAVRILNDEPPSLTSVPGIPGSLAELIARLLRKDPADRLKTAKDLGDDLQRLLAQRTGFEARTAPFEQRPRRGGGLSWLALAIITAAAAVASLAVWTRARERARSHSFQPMLTQVTFAEGIEEYPAWSPDGKQILYVRQSGEARKIFRKNLETGQDSQLTQGNYDELQPAWSPDGRRILFVRAHQLVEKLQPGDVFGMFAGGDIWQLELRSGRESKLAENAFNPSYSPNGQHIAVDASWAGPRRIWVLDSEGHNPQQVTTDSSEAIDHLSPSWSPDGKRIVFQNIERTKFDLRVVDLESKQLHWITNAFSPSIHPRWSPLGQFIYFSTSRGGGLNIWRAPVRSDGALAGALQQVTTGAGQDVELAISRDGKRIAFATLSQNADIWRLPVSPETGMPTGPPQAVISTTREDSRGAWSPDGSAIAFNSDRAGDMNIWLHSIKDGSTRQVTTGRGGDFQPNWSADARKVVFFSSRSGSPNIWEVELAGGKLTALTSNASINVNPFFSPDGRRIAFQSDQSGRLEVWVMNSDGTGARQLTSTGTSGHFLRWTDAGDAVIFYCSPCSGKPAPMKIPISGGDPQPLVDKKKAASHMSFSPDRSRIMDVLGHKVLWVTPVNEGEPQKVFEFPEAAARIDYPVWSPDGKWVLFDRFQPQGGDIWVMRDFE